MGELHFDNNLRAKLELQVVQECDDSDADDDDFESCFKSKACSYIPFFLPTTW